MRKNRQQIKMKSAVVLLGIFGWVSMAAGITPTPTPTQSPICTPGVAEIWISGHSIVDDLGECFDGDGLMDAGEDIGIYVTGYSHDSCYWSPGERSVGISTLYPGLIPQGSVLLSDPDELNFEYLFYYRVSSDAVCMDTATLVIDAYVEDWMAQDSDQESEVYFIEVDDAGGGSYECDAMPCGEVMTPTPTPTATGTCMPCIAEINIYSVSIDDTVGECSDYDGLIDAGESIAITVTGYSMDSCCWTPGDRSVEITTMYPHLTQTGMEILNEPGSFSFEYAFYFDVSPQAQCMDTAQLTVMAHVVDWMWEDTDEQILNCMIEVDEVGAGQYECDDTPCEGEPTVTPTVPPCINNGDTDNDSQLTPADALIAFQIYMGIYMNPTEEVLCSADCSGNNYVTPQDALCIFQHYMNGQCDCADPVMISINDPMAPQVRSLMDTGTLSTSLTCDFEAGTCIMSINLQNHTAEVRSMGFSVVWPGSDLSLLSAKLGKAVDSWLLADVQPQDNRITFGALDPIKGFRPGVKGTLLTLKFSFEDRSAVQGLQLENLNSDLKHFEVIPFQ